jgi:hypothetical protein
MRNRLKQGLVAGYVCATSDNAAGTGSDDLNDDAGGTHTLTIYTYAVR